MKSNYPSLSLSLLVFLSLFLFSSCKKNISPSVSEQSDLSASTEKGTTKGLVGWWTFEGGSLLDKSGYGNDIIFNNATATADRNGNPNGAYAFNGVDNYMQVTNSNSLNPSKITLAAVVKVSDFYGGQCHGNVILRKGLSDYSNGVYSLAFDDGLYWNGQNCSNSLSQSQCFTAIYGNGNMYDQFNVCIAPDYLKKDKWYLLVYTYDGTYSRYFINGTLKATDTRSVQFDPNTSDLFFGRLYSSQYPYWLNGTIDEIRIYNRALSSQEVKSLFN